KKVRMEYDGTRWDGGRVRISVNGSPFAAIPEAAFLQNGYGGNTVAGNSASILAGQPAFTSKSAGYNPGMTTGGFITSVAGGSFNGGDTNQIQLEDAVATNLRKVTSETPLWLIDSFK